MTWKLTIENVAGIRAGEATLEPGVNAVRGSNWQGKSSLIAAIETAMGTAPVLTEGKNRGAVHLETDERTVDVELVREDGTVATRGNPYLDDEQVRTCAALYSFLDDDNEVRRAVRAGDNLEQVLTRPLDFENIDERIADLTRERDQVDAELRQAEEAAERLPAVERQVNDLESELEELRERRAEVADDRNAEGGDGQREELSSAKAERETVVNRIERLERTVERTRDKLEECRERLANVEVPEAADGLEEELASERERYDARRKDAELLQSVYAPTKRLLDEDRIDLITDVQRDLMADDVTCWTCGADTSKSEIADSLERLSDRVNELRQEANRHQERVEELEERREERRNAQRRRSDLETQVADLEQKLDERETSLERAVERREDLDERIERLSANVEAEDDRLADIDGDVKYTEARLEDTLEERDALEARAERRSTLTDAREDITEEITRLRTRKEAMKRRTREAFESAMADLLDRFDIGFETARLSSEFDLVVARDGREASLDALSEGEVELLSIVAALAGHEAFDATDDVPVMLVDGLGGLADENLATLVEYLEERAEFLVVTAYPEHSPFEGNTIDPSDWTVVSPRTP